MPPAGTYQGSMARLGGSSAAPRRAQAGTGRGRGSSAAGPGAPRPPAPRQWRRPRTLTRKLNRHLPAPRLGPAVRAVPGLRSRRSPALAPPPVPVAPGGAGAEAAQPQVICPQFRAEAVASGTAQQGGTRLAGGAEKARGLAEGARSARPQAGRREGRSGTARKELREGCPCSPLVLQRFPAMASDSGDRHVTLKRCLGVLRDARNDSEQFAALLLVRNRGITSRVGKGGAKHPAGHASVWGTWGGGNWELRVSCFRALGFPSAKEESLALTWVCGGLSVLPRFWNTVVNLYISTWAKCQPSGYFPALIKVVLASNLQQFHPVNVRNPFAMLTPVLPCR